MFFRNFIAAAGTALVAASSVSAQSTNVDMEIAEAVLSYQAQGKQAHAVDTHKVSC